MYHQYYTTCYAISVFNIDCCFDLHANHVSCVAFDFCNHICAVSTDFCNRSFEYGNAVSLVTLQLDTIQRTDVHDGDSRKEKVGMAVDKMLHPGLQVLIVVAGLCLNDSASGKQDLLQ